jgi:phospholipid transport system substrate-binding protein
MMRVEIFGGSMRRGLLLSAVILGFLLFVLPTGGARAGEPTDKIKDTTDKIIAIVTNPDLKSPSKEPERRKLIRKAVDERFDWDEMARRSLGTAWAPRTPEEKKEFVGLYGELLERTYLERVESYSGEKVLYQGENIDQDYATVNVKIITEKNTEIPVEYRLRKKGSDWLVYDISIAGVSLVNNYRVQFSSILAKGSYADLVKQLKRKVESK